MSGALERTFGSSHNIDGRRSVMMSESEGDRMTTVQCPARQRRHAARVVLAAVIVVAVVATAWVLGIVGWPGGTFDGAWQLRSAEVDGTALTLPGSRALGLTVETDADEDSAYLRAPCNAYWFTVAGANDLIPDHSTDLTFTEGRSTLVACNSPQLTQLEEDLVGAVRRVDHAELEADVLTLTGPDITRRAGP